MVSLKLRDTQKTLEEINGRPFYDAEANALSSLPKNLYFLVPNSMDLPVCPLEAIGKGSHHFKVTIPMIVIVYALTKKQYETVDSNATIKWATLRMEAFKEGWFDSQKHVRRVETPSDCLTIMANDWPEIKKLANSAWQVVCFVPFLTEFCFRAYGVTYNTATQTEFLARAEKLAQSSQLSQVTNYLPHDIFYGTSLGWIGVKRPI